VIGNADRTARRWAQLDVSTRLLLDIAAGKPTRLARAPTSDELTAAAAHGLLGVMALSEEPLIAASARAPYSRLAARQSAMEGVLGELLEALADRAVPATVVKGPALARWAYAEGGHRTFSDIDLVVPPDRVDDALEALEIFPRTVGIPPKTPKADKRNIPMKSGAGIRFTVDLHWNLFSYSQLRGSAADATEDGWRRATWHPEHPLGPMWELPREMLVAFLATHAVLDHRFRLILFRDLAEVAGSGLVDFDAFGEYVTRHELRSFAYVAWLIAIAAAGAQLPDDVLADLRLPSAPVRAAELLLGRVDPTTFDGHKPHPLNLAMVLLHDRRLTRLRLASAAPAAYPEWLKRVTPASRPATTRTAPRTASPRARILHLLPVDLARGAQTYAKAMRDALDSAEVEHRTATIFESESASLFADVELGVPIGRGRNIGFSPRAFLALYRFLRRNQHDVVIAHGGEALKYAAWAVPRGTKLIYYKIGTTDGLLRNPLRRRFHRALLHRSDLVAGVSREMVTEAVTRFGVPASGTVYMPNGRDPKAFPDTCERVDEKPVVRFIFVGHLTRTKRPDFFVEVVTRLRARGWEVTGVVAGDGPLFERLASSNSAHIEFLGRREDVPDLLASADVFLFTSLVEGEGMPGVLIEAGLAALPTVTTDVPGARTVVADGETGFVVSVDDPDRYVECAERLAASPQLRRQMGTAARDRCMEQFTLTGSLAAWEKQLSELLAGDTT
jgi:glycosyltransferase involved in cell wall biosynthesis